MVYPEFQKQKGRFSSMKGYNDKRRKLFIRVTAAMLALLMAGAVLSALIFRSEGFRAFSTYHAVYALPANVGGAGGFLFPAPGPAAQGQPYYHYE